ncbi:hypothetical protein AN964_12295 [Heyndrickxia shackletonii]|uniref:Uncharacterized protein n=1 Tax=Heyndrickxia shackletonii TaxID=157838 RepID=A0A0Q3WY57_9BACI|nr:hypothetical protein [Heyndrickxia shackletonii]KQL54197.1 hypothetical protein AN964_12295 [Heyndrickxia shackletonii]NEZ02218.1 hypothetical protein [Heyndrickxia shackletonii]
MKLKIIISFSSVVLLIFIFILTYYKVNYKSFDEALSESNVSIDEIFHTTDYKGNTIIFYGKDDILSVALMEKTPLGFRWGNGAGSKLFNEEGILTRAFSNLQPRHIKSDKELVSFTIGVINDPSIKEIKIKYKDQDIKDATIIDTSKGRIWYCFSESPVNYDPEVKVIYKDGTIKTGWY